jgi:tetratricopeptide (TPR) repeat protein
MKVKMFLATIALLSMFLVSGCIINVEKWNPFAKTEKVADTTYVEKAETPKSKEEIVKQSEKKLADTVDSINKGNWNDAIRIGEEAFGVITGSDAQAVVKNSAYALDSTKEKVVETLVEAYDYKTHLEGLSNEEKEKFVRTARAHLNLNPADSFKKLSLAKVLIDTGKYQEGLSLLTEIFNSSVRNKDVTEQYGWALYMSGRKSEAYNIYKTFYPQAETLTQLYHSAIVMEEQNKLIGLILYKGCIGAGNNLMVLEPNVKNLSAQSYINSVITGSQKAFDRLMAGGLRIDSPYNLSAVDNLIKSIVRLSAQ